MKAVYIRTSTEEQTPEIQIRDIETISQKDYKLFQDKQSAWKDDKEREDFERLRKEIQNKKIKDLYVWDWDRLFRNRKKLKEFFAFCKIYQCNVHSYNQKFYETFYTIPEPFNEIMQELFLNLLGWMAEDESNKKSGRVKNAVRRKEGEYTKSYKGNKWGRKELSTQKKNQIKEMQQRTIRDIAKELNISTGVVHKYLSILKREKDEKMEVHQLVN